MNAYQNWLTLRELDQALGAAKGTAFRAFKRLESGFAMGIDYCLLDPATPSPLVEELRHGQRLYASSLRVLLLSPEAAARVLDAARRDPGSDA